MKKLRMRHYWMWSILIVVAAIFATAVHFGLPAAEADSPAATRISDPSTLDAWKDFLGENVTSTANAGLVWMDKTVLTDNTELPLVTMTDPENNFLVALSAIASNKSITGYSHIPTDTMLVLDISRSMGPNTEDGDNNNDAVDELVSAANAAISRLQAVNNYNRVGVVLYSGNYTTNSTADYGDSILLLPLGRYSHETDTYLVRDSQTFRVGDNNVTAQSVKVNNNVYNGSQDMPQSEREVYGGTYIQGGIYRAMQAFLDVEDTTIEGTGFQAGTKRMPIMVLMSDGLPTIATNNYMGSAGSIGTSNMGDGGTPSGYLASAIPFVTQLTASYARERIEEHYDRSSLFYTLGFKVDDSPVLDPSVSNSAVLGHWSTYNNTAANATMQLAVGQRWVEGGWWGQSGHYETTYTSIAKSSYDLSRDYVTQYFDADSSLADAFRAIVDQIIFQSLYTPTLVEGGDSAFGGYLEFIDDIGQHMEVKDIKGIQVADTLFTGAMLTSNLGVGSLGTPQNPTDLGNAMIEAVQTRLGIADIQTADKLVADAYHAGQLAYDPVTGEFSNYIGWYADADGNYLGFASDETDPVPGAVYSCKSYGFLGEVLNGHAASDMMFVSVQVRTNLANGNSAVHYRIPASLIPVVSFNVSLTGTSLEDPGAITLEYNDEVSVDTDNDGVYDTTKQITPLRLIYEVGLSSEINERNVAEIVGSSWEYQEDGVYSFYTNRWDVNDLDHAHPFLAKNTVAHFEPSHENERYYYTENSVVYELVGGNYVPYTGAEKPVYAAGKYFRAYSVFEKSNSVSEGNATMHLVYEAISQTSLEKALPDVEEDESPSSSTTWYIPKGTIFLTLEDYYLPKGEFTDETHTAVTGNNTDSLIYALYPSVDHHEDDPATTENEEHYYADGILGNNGRLSLTAAQGLKITKALDATMIGRTDIFTFEITPQNAAAVAGEYRLQIVAADGTETEQTLTFDSGSETVEIKAGETAWLLDLPVGAVYNVKELTTGKDYQVAAVNNEAVQEIDLSISQGVIEEAAFLNTLKPPVSTGTLVLEKLVEHPFGDAYESTVDREFTFDLSFTPPGGGTPTEDTVTLHAGETAFFDEIEVGTVVSITETTIPDGFTSDASNDGDTKTITIEGEENYLVAFTNTYEPSRVSPEHVNLTGDKSFTGREGDEWLDTDEFTFKLQKRVGTAWEDMQMDDGAGGTITAEATVNKENKTFDFSAFIRAENYDHVGTYSYRIVEVFTVNPWLGITYDEAVRWLDILVLDEDMDGQLEIASVEGFNGMDVESDDATGVTVWDANATFYNTYAPAGSDAISLVVNKLIEDQTVEDQEESLVSKAGYLFGLYQGDDLLMELPATSGAGESLITLTFGSADIGQTIEYILKEIIPENAEDRVPGIQYSKQEYYITVEVEDDTLGGVTATVTALENADGAVESTGEEVTVAFTNTYAPAPVELGGSKTLVGAEISDGVFTFELYDANGAAPALMDSETNTGESFSFDTFWLDQPGDYHYIIKEKAGDDRNIRYDDTEYAVTVTVTETDGVLSAAISVEDDLPIAFTNTYVPDPDDITVDITAKKTVQNLGTKEIGPEGFEFVLKDIAEGGSELKERSDEAGLAEFQLSYSWEDIGKVFNYTLTETDEGANHVTYSDASYDISVAITLDEVNNKLVATITKDGTPVEEVVA
ncbi:MAG: hypothetical protein IJP07_00150, partial [Firmicutes bacterium]|nr:hypothetical protein [Bacillota bacterium]